MLPVLDESGDTLLRHMPLSSWSVVGIAYGLMKLSARKESRSWSGATGAKVNSVKQHHDGTLPAPFTYAS